MSVHQLEHHILVLWAQLFDPFQNCLSLNFELRFRFLVFKICNSNCGRKFQFRWCRSHFRGKERDTILQIFMIFEYLKLSRDQIVGSLFCLKAAMRK